MSRIKPSWKFIVICLLVSGSATTAAAAADWTVVNLHGSAYSSSFAMAVDGATQGGVSSAWAGSDSQATLWFGSADSAEIIQPNTSFLYDIAGSDKVGIQADRATLWQGQANTLIDLHPAGAMASGAHALAGNSQGGQVVFSGPFGHRAALWYGSADSFVDLTPPNCEGGVAAVDAVAQVGSFTPQGGAVHAALWHGTADSVVDLHPEGAYSSGARAIANGRQGGYVQFERDGPCHAALWSGTAESFFDLNAPGGPTISGAIYGMDGNVQVGQAGFVDGTGGATIWFGTPESAFFLGGLLPDDYTETWAYAVDVDEFGTIRVVGSAYNENYYLPDGTHYPRNEAMMWVLVPEPSSLAALAAGLAGLAGVRPRRRR